MDNYFDPYEKNCDGSGPSPAELNYAGFLERLVARIIDVFIVYVAIFVFCIISFFALSFVASAINSPQGFDERASDIFRCCCCMVLIGIFVLEWLYYTLFESSHLMATPGKLLLGMAVTDGNGERVSYKRAAARNVVKLLANQFLGIGSLFILVSSKKQGLYDIVAGTYVVKK